MKKEKIRTGAADRIERPAVGLESEFLCFVDGEAMDPKEAFGDPRSFLGEGAPHRTGTSYHLPNAGAVYFDTGVIEVVTPLIEVGPSSAGRAARALWEGICSVRTGLDEWSDRDGRDVRLEGFSTHYSVSTPGLEDADRVSQAAYVLTHILAFPVMLFAANNASTGVGFRPRPGRIEVTVDFTPDPLLMAATAALAIGAVQEVATWPRLTLEEAAARSFPILDGFQPVPHTSRKGWLARYSCFDPDPFRSPPGTTWRTRKGERLTLRALSRRVVIALLPRIRLVAQPATVRLMGLVLAGRAPSLLDRPGRPDEYADVGRSCGWLEPDPHHPLTPSTYERLLRGALEGRPLEVGGRRYRPEGIDGWTRVRYRDRAGRERVFSLEELARMTSGGR